MITDADSDGIENHFYDLPIAMKRRNRHIVPVGSGRVRVASLPDLHKRTGLYALPPMFIYPGQFAPDSSHRRD